MAHETRNSVRVNIQKYEPGLIIQKGEKRTKSLYCLATGSLPSDSALRAMQIETSFTIKKPHSTQAAFHAVTKSLKGNHLVTCNDL